jgi:hypothetical protein
MSLKTDAKSWTIKEQIVEDQASGLAFQFEVDPNGMLRFRVYGDLPFGNREIIFDRNGEEAGAGTCVTAICRPGWLERLED